MTLQELSLLLTSVLASVAGQFFLKSGALKLGKVTFSNLIGHIIGITSTPELLIGLTCYALGAIAYILLLTRVHLSIVGPAIALSYVFSVLIGYFVFQEPIPISRIAGLGFIIAGVLLVVSNK
ncbi:EamA-like transporter family protein [Leptolyngbya sp. 'hensonii']|uniref:EamA family transporter n=1 Tax=Leptolyngbya sp. 'hensonii' TaxID=1922337 RepID=UPI00094F536A|nr:EamA family transporter [Leptolyngbya sp. 'hensonii']OLP16484.1 EamA-like transporter family protein [Leptolyngbya sp. 'hensonii']